MYGLDLSAGFIAYPTELFQIPPLPSPLTSDDTNVSWSVAWQHNLVQLPKQMAATAVQALNKSTSSQLLMLDYEPGYRPTWNFTCMSRVGQPQWATFLSQIHEVQTLNLYHSFFLHMPLSLHPPPLAAPTQT